MSSPTAEKTMMFGLEATHDRFPSLIALRTKALEIANGASFPTRKDEEWRYTPLNLLRDSAWTPGNHAGVTAADVASAALGDFDQIILVFVNGAFSAELSSPLENEAIEILPLSSAISDGKAPRLGELAAVEESFSPVAAHFGVLKKQAMHQFAALNTASFTDGAFLRLKKNQVVDRPIQLLFLSQGANVGNCARVYVVAEEGSKGTIMETYASVGKTTQSFSNAVVEVFVEPNAFLEHVKLLKENDRATHIGLTEVHQSADCTYKNYCINFGGLTTRNDLNVNVNGQNAHTRLDGVVCLDKEQHVDNHTRLDHAQPNCESYEVYKHLLDDSATAVFNGKIFVHQDAQKTDAKQTNKAILLSNKATMNTKPQLEIFADDVKCTHGATVGALESSMEFYLQSRGIPAQEARAILVYAFAAEVIELIGHEGIRTELSKMLFTKLGVKQ
ncbi:MAG: Fe-S cluster assembly protein SufD [Armatimonadetes bacterium]|nr:Fe-S cluster assembly protein SufD [Armatimonadota bacterium]